MTDLTSSLSGRLRGGRRPAWLRPLLAAGLLALPFLAAWLDGQLERMVSGGYWRPLMMPVVVIAYILLISPLVDRSEARMLRAISAGWARKIDSIRRSVARSRISSASACWPGRDGSNCARSGA